MTKPSQDTISQIVDDIISQMLLEERVSLANINEKDVKILQGIFDLYIRSKIDTEDEEYTEIMNELWKRVRETYRLRVVK